MASGFLVVAVVTHLIVEVGARSEACHPDVPDDVTLLDRAAHRAPGSEATHVGIPRRPSVRMPNYDGVTVGALPGPLDDDAVSGRLHRRPGPHRVVHTPMRPPCLQHGMEPAVAESGWRSER